MDSPDLGPRIRELAKVDFDEMRLRRNRASLLTRLSGELTRKGWFESLLQPRRQIAWAAFSLLFLMSAGAAAVVYFEPLRDIFIGDGTEDSREALTGPDVVRPEKGQVASPRSEEATPDLADEEIAAESPTDFDPQIKGRRPWMKGHGDSTLDDQVRLFNKAKERLASGDHRAALDQLNRLHKRYPATPLYVEAKELRAHVLAGLHRYGQASKTVKALIHAKAPTRKKAQLYRFLGDLQVKQSQCEEAVESYRRALGLGLPAAEAAAAKAGIRNCVP